MHETGLEGKASLSELVIRTRAGTTMRLSDVAQIDDAFPPTIGDAVINGKAGLLIVEKQPWGNTLDVTKRVEAAPATPGMEYDPAIFRPATRSPCRR